MSTTITTKFAITNQNTQLVNYYQVNKNLFFMISIALLYLFMKTIAFKSINRIINYKEYHVKLTDDTPCPEIKQQFDNIYKIL